MQVVVPRDEARGCRGCFLLVALALLCFLAGFLLTYSPDGVV